MLNQCKTICSCFAVKTTGQIPFKCIFHCQNNLDLLSVCPPVETMEKSSYLFKHQMADQKKLPFSPSQIEYADETANRLVN
ncbi:hypothetical protein CEXT_215501 [Caerostris extrusa]|uniref:Uncharacterized protein n=1 Tax=Caerostris extrusa TaxID=172846 RepID=A0AAV4PGN4_CAEEX|nr:hypothetical protein CEXT_215501 [Caerostris extrusa]